MHDVADACAYCGRDGVGGLLGADARSEQKKCVDAVESAREGGRVVEIGDDAGDATGQRGGARGIADQDPACGAASIELPDQFSPHISGASGHQYHCCSQFISRLSTVSTETLAG